MALIEIKNLHTYFKTKKGIVKAVNDVSYSLEPGKTIGIVGESGSGKSISAMSILRLLDSNGYIESGEIIFDGKDLTQLSIEEMYEVRGNAISVIFQEPMTSLNPVFNVKKQLAEPFKVHQQAEQAEYEQRVDGEYKEKKLNINAKYDQMVCDVEASVPEGTDRKAKVAEVNKQRKEELKVAAKEYKKIKNFIDVKVIEMLKAVQIPNPETVARQYPHQLSGGMRQRVMIAMALACKPKILIADEPTTALDVTIQAQILKLMNDLQKTNGTSIIFITHDLGVINEMADDVVVMYCGQVVEQSSAKVIFSDCKVSHPYTEGLMNSIPRLTKEHQKLEPIPGVVPHPLALPKGCKFAPRCKYATEKCMNEEPKLVEVVPGQKIRCFYPNKEERRSEQHKKIVINK